MKAKQKKKNTESASKKSKKELKPTKSKPKKKTTIDAQSSTEPKKDDALVAPESEGTLPDIELDLPGFEHGLSAKSLEIWRTLSLDECMWFVRWVTSGFNGTEASRKFNPRFSYGYARFHAWEMIRRPSIIKLRDSLSNDLEAPLQSVVLAEVEALGATDEIGLPDHRVRLLAARQIREYQLKMKPPAQEVNVHHALNVPPSVVTAMERLTKLWNGRKNLEKP